MRKYLTQTKERLAGTESELVSKAKLTIRLIYEGEIIIFVVRP